MAQYLFRKLTTRLVTTFALLAIPGALLIGFSSYYMARSTLQAGIFDKLESISSIKETNLRWWISELKTDIKWIAGSEELRQPLRVYLLENEDNEDVFYAYQRMADVLSGFIRHDIDLQELFLLSRDDGRVFISTEMSNVGDYGVDDGYFVKGLDETFFQKIYTSPGILKPQTIISTPVVSMYGEKLAVLAARANLDSVDKILMSEAGLGKSGEVYLVDRLNNFVSVQRFGRENSPRGVHSQGIDAGVKEVDGRGLYVNYEGVPVIGVYHWLEDLGLVLMTEIHQDEAFSPARRLGWSLFLIGMSIAAVLLLGSHIISGMIARPILMVRDAAARVARGDLLAKAPVVTGDEVGMLAASFNEMTDHLEHLYNAMQTSEEHFRTVFRMS
ncbi:MAG: HAMP domain-containing protein, partial [Pseudomonadota bacterium]